VNLSLDWGPLPIRVAINGGLISRAPTAWPPIALIIAQGGGDERQQTKDLEHGEHGADNSSMALPKR